MCSCALWDCQTLLHNWVVIKVVFGCVVKHGMGCERIKIEFNPSLITGDISLGPSS
jgi:hypothetical protein